MSVQLQVSGALKPEVIDSKDPLARDMGRQTRRIVKEAGGRVSRFEVIHGSIFMTLKDTKGIEELKKEFTLMPKVQVQEVTPLMLVFMKSAASASVTP
jgi:hypothetical protein